ncbi:NEDD8-activating enzyme E1 regulatory subunit [Acorus calamus]|uniref:NEDD8-activating enzyme E1 regulatory subunit n=2 Tax=Magnoliopsida TaxID=3398 RepID=A0AAV9DUU0_ACOCL|nr:NEDD8-activating enzyme E1 regulatory subunit [Acorus calamus]
MAEPKNKYDRQLRIWGEQGQAALEKASICLLNCGPTGSEALKNLVLGGIGSVTIVDEFKVEMNDLGNNFLVDASSVGQSRAKCVCTFLQELNDAVKAKFIQESPERLLETNPSFFSQFTLIIATQLLEDSILKLDKICREGNVMLVIARSYGLTGIVRISVKEHTVIESKHEHFVEDLRFHNPWPELKQFAESIDLNVVDPVIHKHIPYAVILIKLVEKWKEMHDGHLPLTRKEKDEFKHLIKSLMLDIDEDNYKEAIRASFKVCPEGIGSDLSQILEDGSAEVDFGSSDFWVMVAALKEFIANEGEGEFPLEGSIPDMTSSTEYYVNLQKIYQAKAEVDFLAVEQRVRSILKRIGRDSDAISRADIKTFCRNSRKLAVRRYRSIEDEFKSPATLELQKNLNDEEYSYTFGFYVLLRAVDRFAANYNRFPGLFDRRVQYSLKSSEVADDVHRLNSIAVGILNNLGFKAKTLYEDLVSEMCRFGGAELHAVAAFVGGIASQEVIKLITKQFVPVSGTFIFDGIEHKSQVLPI